MQNAIIKEFLHQSIYRMNESTARITKCLGQIDENETWQSPNKNCNSIGNLLLHLCGNIRQYIVSALGGVNDTRERDKEFSEKPGQHKAALLSQLANTVSEAITIVKDLEEDRLIKIYSVQGFNLSGIGIIIHVTEHYSYHTGQIAFLTKQITNKDLGFYADINLNVKNRS
jgi:uncharacterized damage-inducible protein DinB